MAKPVIEFDVDTIYLIIKKSKTLELLFMCLNCQPLLQIKAAIVCTLLLA